MLLIMDIFQGAKVGQEGWEVVIRSGKKLAQSGKKEVAGGIASLTTA